MARNGYRCAGTLTDDRRFPFSGSVGVFTFESWAFRRSYSRALLGFAGGCRLRD